MPNIFDAIPGNAPATAAAAPLPSANIFDHLRASGPTGNIFDSIPAGPLPPLKLDPLQAAQMQSMQAGMGADPENAGSTLGTMIRGGGSDTFLQAAAPWVVANAEGVLNNPVTRGIGTGLQDVGLALKGGAEANLFSTFGQPDLSMQELLSTTAKIAPKFGAKLEKAGVDISDPYEDARQTLPWPEKFAAGIGPGLIQSAPQLALTAVQPALGAVSFGFTPEGFDPIQAGAMMVAPVGGKVLGGLAEDLAGAAGIENKGALGVIRGLGSAGGGSSIISAPALSQIGQMKPGPDRNAAIKDVVGNAILAGALGAFGDREALSETPAAQNADRTETAVSFKALQDFLRGNLPGHGHDEPAIKIPEEADSVTPGQAAANRAAVLASLPAGFVPRRVPGDGVKNVVTGPDVPEFERFKLRSPFTVEQPGLFLWPELQAIGSTLRAAENKEAVSKPVETPANETSAPQNPADLAVNLKDLQDMLWRGFPVREGPTVPVPSDDEIVNQINRRIFPTIESAPITDALPPTKVETPSLPSELPEADDAGNQRSAGVGNSPDDQLGASIREAIKEKHAAIGQGASGRSDRWDAGDIQRAESAFQGVLQNRSKVFGRAVHDSGFYQTDLAQKLRAESARHGAELVFYSGDKMAPRGFFHGGKLFLRSNRPLSDVVTSFEHEMVHYRSRSPLVSALKNDVDLDSPAAQSVLRPYNSWLRKNGEPPLSEDAAREEVTAYFLAGDRRFGDLGAAFKDPKSALDLGSEYHRTTSDNYGPPAEIAGRYDAPINHSQRPPLRGQNKKGATGSERAPVAGRRMAVAKQWAIRIGEVTGYGDFRQRSIKGDNIEGHELWQHANLNSLGLATRRHSTVVSRNNPVIALDRRTHQLVNKLQREIEARKQTPLQNIRENANILRRIKAAPADVIDSFEKAAIKHAKSLGYHH